MVTEGEKRILQIVLVVVLVLVLDGFGAKTPLD